MSRDHATENQCPHITPVDDWFVAINPEKHLTIPSRIDSPSDDSSDDEGTLLFIPSSDDEQPPKTSTFKNIVKQALLALGIAADVADKAIDGLYIPMSLWDYGKEVTHHLGYNKNIFDLIVSDPETLALIVPFLLCSLASSTIFKKNTYWKTYIWPNLRAVASDLKNGRHAVLNSTALANDFLKNNLHHLSHMGRIMNIINPAAITFGAVLVVSSLAYRQLDYHRDKLIKLNIDAIDKAMTTHDDAVIKSLKICRQHNTTRAIQYSLAGLAGLADGLYIFGYIALFAGFASLNMLTMGTPLIALTVTCVVYGLMSMTAKIYEEYHKQQKLKRVADEADIAVLRGQQRCLTQQRAKLMSRYTNSLASGTEIKEINIDIERLSKEIKHKKVQIEKEENLFKNKYRVKAGKQEYELRLKHYQSMFHKYNAELQCKDKHDGSRISMDRHSDFIQTENVQKLHKTLQILLDTERALLTYDPGAFEHADYHRQAHYKMQSSSDLTHLSHLDISKSSDCGFDTRMKDKIKALEKELDTFKQAHPHCMPFYKRAQYTKKKEQLSCLYKIQSLHRTYRELKKSIIKGSIEKDELITVRWIEDISMYETLKTNEIRGLQHTVDQIKHEHGDTQTRKKSTCPTIKSTAHHPKDNDEERVFKLSPRAWRRLELNRMMTAFHMQSQTQHKLMTEFQAKSPTLSQSAAIAQAVIRAVITITKNVNKVCGNPFNAGAKAAWWTLRSTWWVVTVVIGSLASALKGRQIYHKKSKAYTPPQIDMSIFKTHRNALEDRQFAALEPR